VVKLTYSNFNKDNTICASKINEFYNINKDCFNQLEDIFYEDFNIPKQIVQDNIKRILVNKIENTIIGKINDLQGKVIDLYTYKTLNSFVLYYLGMSYFLFLSIFGAKVKKDEKVDILFDMHSTFDNYYDLFYKKLKRYKLALFICTPEKFPLKKLLKKVNKIFYITKWTSKYFLKSISLKIFKKQFFRYTKYHNLAKQMDFNIVKIALQLQKHIAMHTTEVNGISSNMFLSGLHNGYSPFRYYIYKKKFKYIFLIENGAIGSKTNLCHGWCYTYSDYYIAFSKNISREYLEVKSTNIKYWGSLVLDQKLKIKNENKVYDILFIEELFTVLNPDDVTTSLKFLVDFSKKHKNFSIGYRVRSDKRNSECVNVYTELVNLYNSMINNTHIILDDNSKSSDAYEAVLKSNIIIFNCSSLGQEALAMNKKVLSINFDRKSAHPLSENDDMCILIDRDYSKFEQKLLYLLDKSNEKNITQFYKELKEKFTCQEPNLHDKICQIIEKEIKKEDICVTDFVKCNTSTV
jgi:hypothetical protein